MAEVRRGGKKGRKIGNKSRKPSFKRYWAEGRRERNRDRRMARVARNLAKAKAARAA